MRGIAEKIAGIGALPRPANIDCPPASPHVFKKIRDRIPTRRKTSQLKNGASITPVIGSMQAHMQDDLATPHARRLSAREDEIDRLLEIALRETIHVRRVPVVDLARTARKRMELGHVLRSRRLKRVWQSLQVMLKDSVDHMDMVEDAEHDRCILTAQPVEIPADNIMEAAV